MMGLDAAAFRFRQGIKSIIEQEQKLQDAGASL
jgi:hypothetical protein